MFGTHEARRAAVYRQLAVLETSGIPLATAVQKVVDPNVREVGRLLDAGEDPGVAWEKSGFSSLEVALVKAGVKGGTLAQTFSELEKLFEEKANSARALVAALAYPVLLFHLALLIPQAHVLVSKGLFAYVRVSIVPLACVWGAIFVLVAVFRAAREAARPVVDTLIMNSPVLGGLLRRKAIAHGLQVLGALYRSGIPVRDAMEGARDAATLWPVKEAFARIGERLDQGQSIGDAFLAEEALPVEVREAAATGGATGQLDKTLSGAERRLVEEAKLRQKLSITFTPVLLFMVAACVIGYVVIGFWSNIFAGLDQLTK
jgi:type IV pilus assembly protein PilC